MTTCQIDKAIFDCPEPDEEPIPPCPNEATHHHCVGLVVVCAEHSCRCNKRIDQCSHSAVVDVLISWTDEAEIKRHGQPCARCGKTV